MKVFLKLILIIIMVFCLSSCSENGEFRDGVEAFRNHDLERAIKIFRQIPGTHKKFRDARTYLALSYMKNLQYAEALLIVESSHFPSGVKTSLATRIEEHRNYYEELQKSIIQKKIHAWVPPGNAKKKKLRRDTDGTNRCSSCMMDFVLSRSLEYKLRMKALKKITDPEIIILNAHPVLRLLRSTSSHEQMLAYELLSNYLVQDRSGSASKTDDWPDTPVIREFRLWMVEKVQSPDRECKAQVVNLCKKLKDTESMNLLLPMLKDPDPYIAGIAVRAFELFPDISPALARYDHASPCEKRSIVELASQNHNSASEIVLKKALREQDWDLRWNAARALNTITYETGKLSSPASFRNSKHVILISIDTLRGDRLGCYGFPDRVSPYLDYVAKQNIQVVKAVTNSTWTLPSHVSMLTSLYQRQHAVDTVHDSISDDNQLVSEILQQNNVLTLAFLNNPYLSRIFGFGQGFDVFRDHEFTFAEHAVDYLITWLRWYKTSRLNNTIKQPFFFFLHLNDVHPSFREFYDMPYPLMFEHLKVQGRDMLPGGIDYAMYHSMVYYADKQLGRLFREMKRLGYDRNTLVIITSDHGEAFGEHGYYSHGNKGHYEEHRIPFMLHVPGFSHPVVDFVTTVQNIDIPATILSFLNLPVPDYFQGIDCIARVSGSDTGTTPVHVICENNKNNVVTSSILFGTYKYMVTASRDGKTVMFEGLYDLVADPAEQHSILDERPLIHAQAKQLLHNYLETLDNTHTQSTNRVILDEVTVKRLHQLGYMIETDQPNSDLRIR